MYSHVQWFIYNIAKKYEYAQFKRGFKFYHRGCACRAVRWHLRLQSSHIGLSSPVIRGRGWPAG